MQKLLQGVLHILAGERLVEGVLDERLVGFGGGEGLPLVKMRLWEGRGRRVGEL